jgi:hypothetical protein
MNRTLIALAALAALVLTAAPAAAWPPCTCDPSILDCLVTDGSSPPPSYCSAPEVPSVPPPVAGPDLGDLDPRNWPCTCDPMPEPW